MPDMPPTFRRSGAGARQDYERERRTARERGYDAKWDRESGQYRREHPLCEYCELEGRVSAAELVDHLYPHRGDRWLFWLKLLWVSCCARCHNGMKKQAEMSGRAALDALARRLGRPLLSSLTPGGGQKSGSP